MATFYIEAVQATTIALTKVGSPTVGTCKYGINNTSPSTSYTYGNNISLSAGQKCYFTITSTTTAFDYYSNYLKFTSTGNINCGGNLSDLIGGNTALPRAYCFASLFYNCTKLISASNLILVSNHNAKQGGYYYMFYGCTSLTGAPQIPATAYYSSYSMMFSQCTSLINAPALPAVDFHYLNQQNCYSGMFLGCTSLLIPPDLPSESAATYCYSSMFANCTSLKITPNIAVLSFQDSNYNYANSSCTYMFKGCTSLKTPAQLKATALTTYTYEQMFYGCTGIKLSQTKTDEYKVPYRIPSVGTISSGGSYALRDMFTNTGGTFTGTPVINTTYYLAPSSSPCTVNVTYNGSTILNISSTTPISVNYDGMEIAYIYEDCVKTIKCNGKFMEDNITLAGRTLKCNGKMMASDVVISVVTS